MLDLDAVLRLTIQGEVLINQMELLTKPTIGVLSGLRKVNIAFDTASTINHEFATEIEKAYWNVFSNRMLCCVCQSILLEIILIFF